MAKADRAAASGQAAPTGESRLAIRLELRRPQLASPAEADGGGFTSDFWLSASEILFNPCFCAAFIELCGYREGNRDGRNPRLGTPQHGLC